jgi:hypothetical protein
VQAASCGLCPNGSVTDTLAAIGGTKCRGCTTGEQAPSIASVDKCPRSIQCLTSSGLLLSLCPLGSYPPSGRFSPRSTRACFDCPVGYYQADTSAPSCSRCSECATGARAGCGGVNEGYCANCYPGEHIDSSSDGGCASCPVGYFQSNKNRHSCEGCAKGFYQDGTSPALCLVCGYGKYGLVNTSGNSSDCINCGVGKFLSATGSSTAEACRDCRAGTYQQQEGQPFCVECGAGKHARSPGSTSEAACSVCLPGTYPQAGTGSAFCIGCIAGMYIHTVSTSTLTLFQCRRYILKHIESVQCHGVRAMSCRQAQWLRFERVRSV